MAVVLVAAFAGGSPVPPLDGSVSPPSSGGHAAHGAGPVAGRAFSPGEAVSAETHYVRMRAGLDPDAVPSLVLAVRVALFRLSRLPFPPSQQPSLTRLRPRAPSQGVARSGAADLLRRLLARYPALQTGTFAETNFLTQCQAREADYAAYRGAHAHCRTPPPNASSDPACHTCSPPGAAALFDTPAVRARLGLACGRPLTSQALCAGGALLPSASGAGYARAPPADGYAPVFTLDASKQYGAGVGLASRAAGVLRAVSPRARVAILLRHPADMGRAIYDVKLTEECGPGGVARACAGVTPYEALAAAELSFLNTTAGRAAFAALVNASSAAVAAASGVGNASAPDSARSADAALQAAWAAWAKSHAFPPLLWGRALYTLHGLFAPVILAWASRFAPAGRPILVVQSEAYFADPPGLVDSLFGPFLFGEAAGMAAQGGSASSDTTLAASPTAGLRPAPHASSHVPAGAKAAQSVAQRCALWDLFASPNAKLQALLDHCVAAGTVQLFRVPGAGPMWPRPAECGPVGGVAPQGNVTGSGDYDYAAGDYGVVANARYNATDVTDALMDYSACSLWMGARFSFYADGADASPDGWVSPFSGYAYVDQ